MLITIPTPDSAGIVVSAPSPRARLCRKLARLGAAVSVDGALGFSERSTRIIASKACANGLVAGAGVGVGVGTGVGTCAAGTTGVATGDTGVGVVGVPGGVGAGVTPAVFVSRRTASDSRRVAKPE